MLTEPDLQARYLATTLSVIEAEIRKLDLMSNNRRALAALIAGAARAAASLARELEGSTKASTLSAPLHYRDNNVIPFQAVKCGKP